MARDDYITIAGHRLLVEAVPLLEPDRSLLRNEFVKRHAQDAHQAMQGAYARLDQSIVDAVKMSGLVPACARGCAWCCHGVKVNVSIPEALAVAKHIAKDADNDLRLTVRAAAQRRHGMNTDELFQQGDPCPFLGRSGECRIYDVRPLACRRHCCLDATECERAVKTPRLKLPVQQHAQANAVGVISALALAAALEDAGLDYRTFELATAVAVALQCNATEKWLAGEALFEDATRPVDELDRKIANEDLAKRSAGA